MGMSITESVAFFRLASQDFLQAWDSLPSLETRELLVACNRVDARNVAVTGVAVGILQHQREIGVASQAGLEQIADAIANLVTVKFQNVLRLERPLVTHHNSRAGWRQCPKLALASSGADAWCFSFELRTECFIPGRDWPGLAAIQVHVREKDLHDWRGDDSAIEMFVIAGSWIRG